MTLIDADVFLGYLIFSKHIDSLKCKEVREAIEMSKVDVFSKIRSEIDMLSDSKCDGTIVTVYSWNGMKRRVLDIIDKYNTGSEEGSSI